MPRLDRPVLLPILATLVHAGEPTPPSGFPLLAPDQAARARYESLHLARTHELRWRVVDGRGVEVDVERWAYLTGDDQPWRVAAWRSVAAGWAPRVAGLALLGLAVVPATAIGEPPSGGPGREAWTQGTTEDDVLLGAASVLAGSGLALVALSFADTPAHNVFPPLRRYRTALTIDERVEAYNAALAAELSVTR